MPQLLAPVAIFLGFTGIGVTIASYVGAFAIAFGFNYVINRILAGPKKDQPADAQTSPYVGGTQLNIRIDPEVPRSLLVGKAVTAGSMALAATYGVRGEVDNSDLIQIIALADHACDGLEEVYIDNVRVTLTGVVTGDVNPVVGTNIAGYDDLIRFKFFDGTQTEADSYAVGEIGTHGVTPWTGAMIGTDIAYVRLHCIYEQDRVPGLLQWKFVVRGIKLYDPRLDTTVGGSGSHRWGQPETYEWTDNVAVIIYNICRGIYVNDKFFYGIENTTADQFPLDTWFASMNECDALRDISGSGPESQYRAGGEISTDTEPRDTILELLKCCDGRFGEIGGVYTLHVGPPGLPVYAFDDGELLATQKDSFHPILGLEQRINYVTGTYTSPEDGWIPKAGPPRNNDVWEQEDGRQKPIDLNVPMVQSGTQLQRLQLQMLNRSRRERKHSIPLPPPAMIVEPGDVVEWTSDRNGYDGKLFEVDEVQYDSNLNVILAVTEVDPDDYDWTAASDQFPEADGQIAVNRPAAKVISGFTIDSVAFEGDDGTRRPAIRLFWDDPRDNDIVAVNYQMRRPSQPLQIVTGGTNDPTAEELIIVGDIQPNTRYEVRARFQSFNGYATAWSLWLPVTTVDARITAADMSPGVRALLAQLDVATGASLQRSLDDLRAQIEIIAQQANGSYAIVEADQNRILQAVGSRFGVNEASIIEVRETFTDQFTALATQITQIFATTAEGTALGTIRFAAISAPAGVAARYAIELRATTADDFAQAGLFMDVGVDELGGSSRILMQASQFMIQGPVAPPTQVFEEDGTRVVIDGSLVVGRIESPDGVMTIELRDTVGPYILIGEET